MKRNLRKVSGRTRQARKAGEDAREAHASAGRRLNDFLLFWKYCPGAACRRACACSGDPDACFSLFWPRVPEDIKNDVRAMICKAAGKPEQADIYRRAAQEIRDAQAALAREAPPQTSAEPAQAPREPHMPRIRVL